MRHEHQRYPPQKERSDLSAIFPKVMMADGRQGAPFHEETIFLKFTLQGTRTIHRERERSMPTPMEIKTQLSPT